MLFSNVHLVIAGSVADSNAACQQLRAAAENDSVGESHMAMCVPQKVCSIPILDGLDY
jgi:hypothetical protein